MRVLVIEDEEKIREVLKLYLDKEGYETHMAKDGEEGLALFHKLKPAFLLLDLMLPKLSGEKVCKEIRKESNVPIIMLTAKDQEMNRITGLQIGADDYVLKPFSPKELMVRMKVILRRLKVSENQMLLYEQGSFIMDKDAYTLQVSGKKIELTKNEFDILWTLAQKPNRVYKREQIIEAAFAFDFEGYDRTIDVHIKNIRKKIARVSHQPYIHTIYGVGYTFRTGEIDEA